MTARTFALLLILAVPLHAQKISQQTADWIRTNINTIRDTKRSVQVVAVRPDRVQNDRQWFGVFTWDGYGNGSWIDAVVPLKEAPSFVERYGTSIPEYMTAKVRNKRLDAIVRVNDNNTAYLEVGDHAELLSSGTSTSTSSTRIRTWTDNQGRTITAEYIRHTAETVTIRKQDDGLTYTLPIETLSLDDRKWVASQ